MKKSWLIGLTGVLLAACCSCSQVTMLQEVDAAEDTQGSVEETADTIDMANQPSEEEAKSILAATWVDEESQSEYILSDDGTYLEIYGNDLYEGTWMVQTEEDSSYFHLQTSDDPEHDYAYRYVFNDTKDTISFYEQESGALSMTWSLVTELDDAASPKESLDDQTQDTQAEDAPDIDVYDIQSEIQNK
jgi:hypothetical protein